MFFDIFNNCVKKCGKINFPPFLQREEGGGEGGRDAEGRGVQKIVPFLNLLRRNTDPVIGRVTPRGPPPFKPELPPSEQQRTTKKDISLDEK